MRFFLLCISLDGRIPALASHCMSNPSCINYVMALSYPSYYYISQRPTQRSRFPTDATLPGAGAVRWGRVGWSDADYRWSFGKPQRGFASDPTSQVITTPSHLLSTYPPHPSKSWPPAPVSRDDYRDMMHRSLFSIPAKLTM
jgi:hypothetical protein